MPLRLTTWNVNGIRNPFGYQPWHTNPTFPHMFDVLEADIVVMQELKIQKKDLRDDMVLLPGWDCYFSLPKHKKGGYPSELQLLSLGIPDPAILDTEGRCVVLEFPAFVLFGVYSPANSNGLRDDFRYAFLRALDIRLRNLVRMGKKVILTGDLNVSRTEVDTASAEDDCRKMGITHEDYISTPNRRIFNQLLLGGEVVGERDKGREEPIMYDLCRGFHEGRKGMYTHWEQKINARPGNHGSRIDYMLCSITMKDWFSTSNIQEGLMGSDHCPVFAVFKDDVELDSKMIKLLDIMNPPGMFMNGQRQREWSTKDLPAFSARLLPEFDKRRSIKDMFSRKPSLKAAESPHGTGTPTDSERSSPEKGVISETISRSEVTIESGAHLLPTSPDVQPSLRLASNPTDGSLNFDRPKRKAETIVAASSKRSKSNGTSTVPAAPPKGQQKLSGFFKPKNIPPKTTENAIASVLPSTPAFSQESVDKSTPGLPSTSTDFTTYPKDEPGMMPSLLPPFQPETLQAQDESVAVAHSMAPSEITGATSSTQTMPARASLNIPKDDKSVHADDTPDNSTCSSMSAISSESVHDPIVSKESWGKLFTKPAAPRCEGHQEPCMTMRTKKKGENQGRSFWMCARPVGPSGTKERNTQWRCPTFIWCSDWTGSGV
ncbi:hypothetical protein LTR04_002398 [Oleoguttula sp. CCFEE 6159]|nr:hypothetical protein LTR04_002398 [Oleoguttula sp. CCFEE 6159]